MTAPTAKSGLTHNGSAQDLVNPGSATGGAVKYSTSRTGEYSDAIPTGTDAKEYSVWYKVEGDANHTDTAPAEIKVTIAPLNITDQSPTITLGEALTYTGAVQTQTVSSVTGNGLPVTYTVSGNTGVDVRDDYVLTVTGTGNFTGTATIGFSIDKKSVTGTNQTLLVKPNTDTEQTIDYDLSKLLPIGVTGTTTYTVVADGTSAGSVLSSVPTNGAISADGKLTLNIKNVAEEDQIVTGNQNATVKIAFANANYVISEATLTIKTTDKTPVFLSGVTCGNRAYNGNAYAYTGTPVWKTGDGETVTVETKVTYYIYKAEELSAPVDAPTNAGSYLAVFTFTSDEYEGTASYSFEITKAMVTVAAKNKSIYVGDTVPDLTNPKAGTYEILISGLTAPEGDNYTITLTNGTLTIAIKPSGGGSSSGGSTGGGSFDSGSSSGGSTGGGSFDSGSSSGGSTGGGSSSDNGSTGAVITGKDSESDVTITTLPIEVKVENGTASATVKDGNVTEAIKQAADNTSAAVVLTVSEKECNDADKVQLTMYKSDVQQILDKTDAELVVATAAGDVSLPQDVLGKTVSAAVGQTLSVELEKVTKPTEVQKAAAGENSYIVDVTISSKNEAITTFGGAALRIRLEVPEVLAGKDVAAIHIAEDGKTEKMPGKKVKKGTKEFYEFATSHLSTFALVDGSMLEEEIVVPEKGILLTDSATKLVFKVTKSGKTGGTVSIVRTENTKAKTITVPEEVTFDGITYKVTSIGAYAFRLNTNITKVVIGKNVTYIGYAAFSRCTNLKYLTIGENVTSIGKWAFYQCSGLTKLTIPAKVKKIGDHAFNGCSGLTTIKLNTTLLSDETVSERAFRGLPAGVVVSVPESKEEAYKTLLVKLGLSKKATIKSMP